MKFIKLDLLTLLISLFLFASCENTATIGLEVDPSIAIQGDLVDTATVTSQTLAEDPWVGNTSTRFPFGLITDPVFGTTEASLAMSVTLPNTSYVFGNNAVVDSAVLVLRYGTEFYGDSTSTYSMEVRQLNLNLSRETSFPSTREYASFPTVIGTKTGKIYPNTTYRVTDVVAGRADTLRTVTPQIRIPLDRNFVQNVFASADTSRLKTNAIFARYFGGLQLKVNKTSSNGKGGIAFFNLSDANSGVTIYYKRNNATTATTRDTVSTNFPINSTAAPIAATVKHDYTGTEIAKQLSTPTQQYPVTYLQPLGGLKNKISFPQLKAFTANFGKVAVNKAELVIDLADGTDVIPFNAAPRLALYRYDIAGQRQNLPDNNPGSQTVQGDPRYPFNPLYSFGGTYDPIKKQYIFNVTLYIQDLLDGNTKDYGTFLAPIPSSAAEATVFPSFATAARSVIASFKKGRTASDRSMKLNIYYTKIN